MVQEVGGSVGNGGVAWLEESVTDHVAEDESFSIDGLHGDGSKDVKNDWEGTDSMQGSMEVIAAQRATFLTRGLMSKAENTKKESTAEELLNPRETQGLAEKPVVVVTTAGENLTMVSEEHWVTRETETGAGILCKKHQSHVTKDGSMVRLCVWLLSFVVWDHGRCGVMWQTEQLVECPCGRLAGCRHHGRLHMPFCAPDGVRTGGAASCAAVLVIWSSAASCIRYCNMQMKLPDALSGWMINYSPILTRAIHSSCPTCNQTCILH